MCAPIDRDEAFWEEIRLLPPEVKDASGMLDMFVFKSKVQQLYRDIEDAIRLKIAGWTASLPDGPLLIDRVYAWQWRRPGPKGGRIYLSTNQAIKALRRHKDDPKLPR